MIENDILEVSRRAGRRRIAVLAGPLFFQLRAASASDQMSVRMKPSTRALIENLADAEGVPIAEIHERAIAIYTRLHECIYFEVNWVQSQSR